MNKKYVIGGVIVVCAGIAGWFGMRAVETQTEQAVAEALAAVPAKANEIRYSLLGNTLALKGVTYELSGDGLVHRGAIDNVEVKGFNRKYVFTKSDAPYSPDTLPVVAESISMAGIEDSMTMGQSTVEQKVEKVQLTGWYQRLGTLLTLHREQRGGEAFFEELYRCRIDGMEASNVSMKISGAEIPPVDFSMGRMALLEGIRAPKEGEKVSPASLGFFDLRVSGKDFSGGLNTLEIRDIRMPEPEIVAELFRTGRQMAAMDEEELFGDLGEKLFTDLDRAISKAYEDRMPVGRIFMEGGTFSMQDTPEEQGARPAVFAMTMKSLDYRLSMTEQGACRYVTDLSGLKMKFPDTMEEYDILSRYAPDGLTISATSDSLLSRDAFSGKARYELEGLGVLEGDMAMLGDVRGVLNTLVYDAVPSDVDTLLQSLRVQSIHVVYKDSGLMPMGVEIAARWNGSTAESVYNEFLAFLQNMAQEKERPVRELGEALLVMCDHPGEISMSIAPEKPMNLTEAAMLASLNPDALPLTFSSKPGTRAFKDYLLKK